MSHSSAQATPLLDRTAVVLSGLCLLHCLALPFLILGTPFVAVLAGSHWHAPMLLLVVPVSVFAIVMGYRRHGNRAIVAAAAVGLLLLIFAGTVAHDALGATVDRTLTVTASLLLAAVHWRNSRLVRHARSG